MKNNEKCEACRAKLFRLAQTNHSSQKMRSVYTTMNRILKDMEILKTKLTDVAVEELLNR